MKQENLPWLSENPFYTKRFAFFVGRRCRGSTIADVAKEVRLNWKTVKDLEKQYMREQLRRTGISAPEVIGVDEISIKKGHIYRIVVSDLIRKRAIWFGGESNSEEDMDLFYKWLGEKKVKKIRLVVMDMWKAFAKSVKKNVPKAAILYDKFHVMKNLGEAWPCAVTVSVGRSRDPWP
ncbi:MAG: transposase [Rectinemataceae bacterium]|nr:transposase [Rectinemataceae bacterium]